jgi:hypothetical protein
MRYLNYAAFLLSAEWRAMRLAAIHRAGGRCLVCNSSERLEVHHRTYERVGGGELPDDLVVLCDWCHGLFHECRQLAGLIAPSGYVAFVDGVCDEEPDRQCAFVRVRLAAASWSPSVERDQTMERAADRLGLTLPTGLA